MGNHLNAIVNRLLDYPLKKNLPCAFESDIPLQGNSKTEVEESHYDKIVNEFERKLLEKRIENLSEIDGKTWGAKKLLRNFPGWNESTISYLHSLFLTFCNQDNKMIDFKSFSCILMCLDCDLESKNEEDRFRLADLNYDGFIDYSEFLELIFSYENLECLARIASEKTQFITHLSIGQQLEHGLF